MKKTLFCKAEDDIIRAGVEEKISNQRITDRLALAGYFRTRGAVNSRRRTLRLYMPGVPVPMPGKKRPPSADYLFKTRMLKAMKSGQETAIMGVVKDHRPFALNTIRAEPVGSVFGSQAAACADA